jgi:hypothetical protein
MSEVNRILTRVRFLFSLLPLHDLYSSNHEELDGERVVMVVVVVVVVVVVGGGACGSYGRKDWCMGDLVDRPEGNVYA